LAREAPACERSVFPFIFSQFSPPSSHSVPCRTRSLFEQTTNTGFLGRTWLRHHLLRKTSLVGAAHLNLAAGRPCSNRCAPVLPSIDVPCAGPPSVVQSADIITAPLVKSPCWRQPKFCRRPVVRTRGSPLTHDRPLHLPTNRLPPGVSGSRGPRPPHHYDSRSPPCVASPTRAAPRRRH
jgi:hypothetical protein